MIDKDRNQTIIFDIESTGRDWGSLGAFRALTLMNATDPEDPSEVEHPLNVGEGMMLSCSGSTPYEAKESLIHGLRCWGFTGPIIEHGSDEYREYLGARAGQRHKGPNFPLEKYNERQLKFHYKGMDDDMLELFIACESKMEDGEQKVRIMREVMEERKAFNDRYR